MDSEEFRRARWYAAWILLAAAAVQVFLGAWTLSGLPGSPLGGNVFHSGSIFGPATAAPFWLRADDAFRYLVAITVTALPVAAVLLVALAGRPPGGAYRVTLTAVIIQTVALALGVVAWLGTLSHDGSWTLASTAVEIAVAVAGLILTNALLRSRNADPRTRPRAGARKR
jgi:hypothetical protein